MNRKMTISQEEIWEIFSRDDNYDYDDVDNKNNKSKHTIRERRRSLFVATNKTITIFAVASLLAITAFTTLRAQEPAPSGGSPNPPKRLLVATETSSADIQQTENSNNNNNNNNSPAIETGGSSPATAAAVVTRKLVDSSQPGGASGQASAPVRPTKIPALARSTPSELLLTRSTRQTKASTRKSHSTTVASGPDDDVTASTTTPPTSEPPPRGGLLADDQADQAEPSGKAAAVAATSTGGGNKAAIKDKDKKRSQAKQRRGGEEEEETEDTDEDEERDRERERARRRKLRNRLKTSTTTTTSTTTSTTTRAPTSTTSSTTSSSSTTPIEPTSQQATPTQVIAMKNVAHQHHQNTSHSQPTVPAAITKQSSNSPATAQELPKLPAANGTTFKGPMGLGAVKLDDAKVVKLNDGPMTSGDPSVQSTTLAVPIVHHGLTGDLMVGNKSLSELVRDTINEQTSNTVPKGLGDTAVKHVKLICSVSTAPISAAESMGGGAFGLKTIQNTNDSLNQASGPFVTGDANQTLSSSLLKPASHIIPSNNASNNSSPVSHDHSSNLNTTNELPNNSTTLGGHDHGKLSTNSSASLLDSGNRKSNNNSLVAVDNNRSPGSGAGLNSTGTNQARRVDGKEVVKATERNRSVDHEKIEDHVKEQAESLRHFIVICSISVVVATSLIFAILTLLLK